MIEDNYKRYFSHNNLLKSSKHILFNAIFNFINNKIKEFYNNNNGKETFRKQLKRIKAKQIYELNLNFNRELLHKTIKDIFSNDNKGRIKDYNKKIIENLLNEKDITIKNYFSNLFNLTFIQCLEHYRGSKFYNELNGMKLLKEEINTFMNENKEYALVVEYYFENYESILNFKKSRRSKKRNHNEN